MDWKIKMTKEEIIEMAKEAGLAIGVALDGSKSVGKHEDKSFAIGRLPLEDFVAFAKMIAEKEREQCAKIFDDAKGTGRIASCREAADAIRARGQE